MRFPAVGAVYDRPQSVRMHPSKLWAVIDRPYSGNLKTLKFGFAGFLRQTEPMHTPMSRHLLSVILVIFAVIGSSLPSSAQTITTTTPQTLIHSFMIGSGRWESLQWNLDIWVLDLKVTDGALTGNVSVIPGPSRSTSSVSGPVGIYDGKIDQNQIEFKVKSPDGMRAIRFTGLRTSAGLRFTRSVELLQPGASPGIDDLFGTSGPASFVVKQPRPLVSKRARHIDQ